MIKKLYIHLTGRKICQSKLCDQIGSESVLKIDANTVINNSTVIHKIDVYRGTWGKRSWQELSKYVCRLFVLTLIPRWGGGGGRFYPAFTIFALKRY